MKITLTRASGSQAHLLEWASYLTCDRPPEDRGPVVSSILGETLDYFLAGTMFEPGLHVPFVTKENSAKRRSFGARDHT